MKQLLLNRKFFTSGNWYSSLSCFASQFKSVVDADFLEMTSSAGDWSGYIVQKILGKFYLILFWQENSYPVKGFDVYTNDDYLFKFDELPTKEEIQEMCWSAANL